MDSAPEPEFSIKALELAKLYDTLSEDSQYLLDTVARIERDRQSNSTSLPKNIVPASTIPMHPIPYIGTLNCTGSIETKQAAKQELAEMAAELSNVTNDN